MEATIRLPGCVIHPGDCLTVLRALPDESVACCITSPPYFSLRDYQTGTWEGGDPACDHAVRKEVKIASSTLSGRKATTGQQQEGYRGQCGRCGAIRVDRQIGLEETPALYVAKLVEVFREVRRVLKDDGTLWLNIGDSYASSGTNGYQNLDKLGERLGCGGGHKHSSRPCGRAPTTVGLKNKDLIGVPWLLAFAMRDDGWYLRSEVIWHKLNSLPESVTDRPTKSHEQVFLLAKNAKYYYDADAIAEQGVMKPQRRAVPRGYAPPGQQQHGGFSVTRSETARDYEWRNKRSVWNIPLKSFPGAHFAVMPEALVEPCILAGCPEGGVVLDPFAGAGTVGVVALRHGRKFLGIELNPDYVDIARKRIEGELAKTALFPPDPAPAPEPVQLDLFT